MEARNKIRSFKDLEAWKYGHTLVLSIYRVTNRYPKNEQFGITNQMRRAAVSITSNIAEGFSRQSSKEKCQFYSIALGSLTELQNQLLISKDIGYLAEADFQKIDGESLFTQKLIHGLLKYVRRSI